MVSLMIFAVPASAQQDTITVASSQDCKTLDPLFFSNTHPERSVGHHFFDGLVWREPNGEVAPNLATSWKMIDDYTWEFKLREGVKFHNGEPFNAEAVKYTFERIMNDELQGRDSMPSQTTLKEVKVVDEYTVRFITEEKAPTMLYWLAESMIVAPEHYSSNDLDYLSSNPVGTGPYKFEEWQRGSRIVMSKFEDYWGENPDAERIIWRNIPETSTRIAELTTGNIDIAVGVPPDQIESVKTENSDLAPVEGLRKYFVGMPLTNPKLESTKVRRALNYAVDVETLIETLASGYGERLSYVINPPNNNKDLEAYEYNPEKARELLAEAGYEEGFSIDLYTTGGTQYFDERQLSVAIASYLNEVGLDVTVKSMEESTFRENLFSREFDDLFLVGFGALINPMVEAMLFETEFLDNVCSYSNPEYDELVNKANSTMDRDERIDLINKAEEIVWNDPPWLYLWQPYSFYGISEELEWEPRPDDWLILNDAEIE